MKALKLQRLCETEEGKCRARHYRTGRVIEVEWRAGRLAAVSPAADSDDVPWIAPALCDLQVNGYSGVDFQRAEGDPAARMRLAAEGLRRDGCARVLLTLITASWPELLERARIWRDARNGDPALRRIFFGWHIEGPFLSAKPGFSGAHDPACMRDPAPGLLEELRAILPEDPILLTLAPERPGSEAAIRRAVELGMKVSLGHTDAGATVLRGACQAGARMFTHLGNGCPQQLDRHDNILWRVLDGLPVTAGLIPDGHHVAAPLFRLIHRQMPPDRIYWTTDAMSGAGCGPGRFTVGRLEIEVGEDLVARQPGASNFAGSALRPLEGVVRGARMLGCSWREAWDHFSVIPGSLMGLSLGLEEGNPAAFCLLEDCGG